MELVVPFDRPLVPARYVSRPHRFAVLCQLDAGGEPEACHLPDPGRLRELLTPGRRLWLEGPFGAPRRLRWGVVLAEAAGTFVHLVPARANRLFPAAVEAGALRGLLPPEAAGHLQPEVARGDARLDFVWSPSDGSPSLAIEVKAAVLRRGDAVCWPDAPSQRALKHLGVLREEVAAGRRAALVFIAGRGDVARCCLADDIDPVFGAALRSAAAAGVEVHAARFSFDVGGAGAPAALRVDLAARPCEEAAEPVDSLGSRGRRAAT